MKWRLFAWVFLYASVNSVAMAHAIAKSTQAEPAALVGQAALVLPGWPVSSPFEESLLAHHAPSAQERQDLEVAIAAYRKQSNWDDLSVFQAYLKQHPDSVYKVALQTNFGLYYYRHGYFTKAFAAWEEAWQGRDIADDTPVKALVDRAIGELIRMHARLGHADELERLLKEVNGRPIVGQATEAIAGAKEGLWKMRNDPGLAFLCGPKALRNVLNLLEPGSSAKQVMLDKYRSGPRGISMAEVEALGHKVGLDWQPSVRIGNAAIPVPSVVHWKVNHYAAIVSFDGKHYHIKDPTFGGDLWVTQSALDAESSGYFLIPKEKALQGWRVAHAEEKRQVHGMGDTGEGTQDATTPEDTLVKRATCSTGCATYDVHAMLVSLHIEDTPVSYRPGRGPVVDFKLSYNQRDISQPSTPNFSNIGAKWTHNWSSFIEDDPNSTTAAVKRVYGSGGARAADGFNASSNTFSPSSYDGALLTRASTNPIRYELLKPDGSKLIYGYINGAQSSPRRVFLSSVVDPQGNAVVLGYDNLGRLVTVTDAAGQVSRLYYESSLSSLLLTRFTNPAGQSALLSYNSAGQLQSITDAVGMVSSFSYGNSLSADFINAMVTPYGNTSFEYGEASVGYASLRRWLIATDPLGRQERVEFRPQAPGVPYTEDVVPNTGMENSFFYWRNTFYWDKQAYSLYGPASTGGDPDYTKAYVYHWLHDLRGNTARVLESVKAPLDRRVWYKYQNQSRTIYLGTFDQPTSIAKVLPDGSTQETKKEYNSQGNVTRVIDPTGRDVYIDYATNGIDVLTVRRKTSATTYTTLATYTYNSLHRPLTYKDAAGQTTTYTYNGYGQLTSEKDPLGHIATYDYRPSGYLGSITNANNALSAILNYDNAGNLTRVVDSQLSAVDHEYDALNRKVTTFYPDNTSEQWVYDKLDVASYTNRLNTVTTYTHNANRELTETTTPVSSQQNQTRSYTYTPTGKLSLQIAKNDSLWQLTSWTRDLQGRVLKKQSADGKGDTYTYDLAGRLSTKTDALGQVTTLGYTTDDRIASVALSNAANPTPATTYVWDSYYPRLRAMTDGVGTSNYTYVAPGQWGALQLQCDSGQWAAGAICYGYDAGGRVSSRTIQAANLTDTSTWTYDALNRVASETLGRLGTLNYTYLGSTDQVLRRSGPLSSLTTSYTYESDANDRRLKQISHVAPAGALGNTYAYQSDALGRINAITTGPSATGLSLLENYTYGPSNRLVIRNATESGVSDTAAKINTFDYDAEDNLLSITSNGKARADAPATFAINKLNQAVTRNGVSRTYDANGSVKADGSLTYAWDGHNRLVGVGNAGTTGNFSTWVYDGQHRRAQQSDAGVIQRYRWCGQELCAILDGSGNVKAFLYGDAGEYNAGQALLYSEDHLGNVRHVNNAQTGAWLMSVDYDSYGAVKDVRCNVPGNCDLAKQRKLSKGYAGLYWHSLSGLYLGTYRAYDPAAARWLNRDPIGERGGVNLYSYVGGNPISGIDPYGLFDISNPADWPTIPQPATDFMTGIADDVSFGLGPVARNLLSIDGGVNPCSDAYKAGQYGAMGVGVGRIGYASLAKGISMIPSLTGREVSTIRNGIKRLFRGPFARSKYRIYSYEQLLAEKGSDVAVKAAAGRTSPGWNSIGIDAGAGGAANSQMCGCP
jgi:RHS repeat-associated protein